MGQSTLQLHLLSVTASTVVNLVLAKKLVISLERNLLRAVQVDSHNARANAHSTSRSIRSGVWQILLRCKGLGLQGGMACAIEFLC